MSEGTNESSTKLTKPLEKIESRWEKFFRKLQIAGLAIILFQLLVFPRLVNRYEALQPLQNDQKVLMDIKSKVDLIPALLESGKASFDIEAEYKKLETIEKLKELKAKKELQAKDALIPVPLFLGPSDEDRKSINETIVKPLVENMDTNKNKYLIVPFSDQKRQLELVLDANNDLLKRNGIDAIVMKHDLNTIERRLALPFSLPEIVPDYEPSTKTRYLRAAQVEIDSTSARVSETLKALSGRFASSLDQSLFQTKKLDDQISELKKQIEGKTKLFPFLVVDPDDLMLYYPGILAIVISYFAWTFLRLQSRSARALSSELHSITPALTLECETAVAFCFLPSKDADLSFYAKPVFRQTITSFLCCVPLLLWVINVRYVAWSHLSSERSLELYALVIPLSGLLVIISVSALLRRIWYPPQVVHLSN